LIIILILILVIFLIMLNINFNNKIKIKKINYEQKLFIKYRIETSTTLFGFIEEGVKIGQGHED